MTSTTQTPSAVADRGVDLARRTYARLDAAGDDGVGRVRLRVHQGGASWFNRVTRQVQIGAASYLREPGEATRLEILETTAHEVSHKWFDARAGFGGLVYAGRSGALSEGLAQTMSAASLVLEGTPAEQAHGWDVLDPAGSTAVIHGLRTRELPLSRTMDDVRARGFTINDQGLVHVHSGVVQAAHLHMARATDMETMARITTDAARADLSPVTGFRGWATATRDAAARLYGADATQVDAVRDAWRAAGVVLRS